MYEVVIEETGWAIGTLSLRYPPEYITIELVVPQRTWSVLDPPRVAFTLAGQRMDGGANYDKPRWRTIAIRRTEITRGDARQVADCLLSIGHSQFAVALKGAMEAKTGLPIAQSSILAFIRPCLGKAISVAVERQKRKAEAERFGVVAVA